MWQSNLLTQRRHMKNTKIIDTITGCIVNTASSIIPHGDAIFLDVSAEFLTKSTTVPKPPSGMLAPSPSSDFQSCRGITCKPKPNVLVAELLSNSDFSPLILSYFVPSRFVETSLPAHMIVCLKSTASVCVTVRKPICCSDREETRGTR